MFEPNEALRGASPAEKAYAARADKAEMRLLQWDDELRAWDWPAEEAAAHHGFIVPSADERASKRRKISASIPCADDAPFWGSLPELLAVYYENRLDAIRNEMDDLDLDGLKAFVLRAHAMQFDEHGYHPLSDSASFITGVILQFLPRLSSVLNLVNAWIVRLSVLSKTPLYLDMLQQTEERLDTAFTTVEELHECRQREITAARLGDATESKRKTELSAQIPVLKRDLGNRTSQCGRIIDTMLDNLEGRHERLPPEWINRMDMLETEYSNWIVLADRAELGLEWPQGLKRQSMMDLQSLLEADRDEPRARFAPFANTLSPAMSVPKGLGRELYAIPSTESLSTGVLTGVSTSLSSGMRVSKRFSRNVSCLEASVVTAPPTPEMGALEDSEPDVQVDTQSTQSLKELAGMAESTETVAEVEHESTNTALNTAPVREVAAEPTAQRAPEAQVAELALRLAERTVTSRLDRTVTPAFGQVNGTCEDAATPDPESADHVILTEFAPETSLVEQTEAQEWPLSFEAESCDETHLETSALVPNNSEADAEDIAEGLQEPEDKRSMHEHTAPRSPEAVNKTTCAPTVLEDRLTHELTAPRSSEAANKTTCAPAEEQTAEICITVQDAQYNVQSRYEPPSAVSTASVDPLLSESVPAPASDFQLPDAVSPGSPNNASDAADTPADLSFSAESLACSDTMVHAGLPLDDDLEAIIDRFLASDAHAPDRVPDSPQPYTPSQTSPTRPNHYLMYNAFASSPQTPVRASHFEEVDFDTDVSPILDKFPTPPRSSAKSSLEIPSVTALNDGYPESPTLPASWSNDTIENLEEAALDSNDVDDALVEQFYGEMMAPVPQGLIQAEPDFDDSQSVNSVDENDSHSVNTVVDTTIDSAFSALTMRDFAFSALSTDPAFNALSDSELTIVNASSETLVLPLHDFDYILAASVQLPEDEDGDYIDDEPTLRIDPTPEIDDWESTPYQVSPTPQRVLSPTGVPGIRVKKRASKIPLSGSRSSLSSAAADSTVEEKLDQTISSLLTRMPGTLRWTREQPNTKPAPKRTVSRVSSREPEPRRTRTNESSVRVYRFHRINDEPPIRLFVRLVGESGERVMVRVGGGWSDLEEYLRAYAQHHGRRTISEGKIEVQDVSVHASGRCTPVSRPGSSMSFTPRVAPSPLDTRSPATPPMPNLRISTPPSRLGEGEAMLGLAGPRTRLVEMSPEDAAWVEDVKGQVRKVSAARKERASSMEFGEMAMVGGTRRLFMKRADA